MKEPELVTIPWNCPTCKTCRLIVKGTYGCSGPRQCIAGGPYKGFQVLEKDNDAGLQSDV